jgi:DNA-binding protein YbaB
MLGNITQLLEMKKKAEELKAKLEHITVTEVTHGITVDCNGNRKVLAIHIPQEMLQDKVKLEDSLILAVNNAVAAAEKASINDMASMAGGLGSLGALFGK